MSSKASLIHGKQRESNDGWNGMHQDGPRTEAVIMLTMKTVWSRTFLLVP